MSTLYIRLPSKAAADNAPHWIALTCPYALVAHGGAIEHEGERALSDLAGTIAKAQRVVLLLAAGDVSLLRVKVPPLPPAKLKAALPNMVEDQLVSDPAECVIVAGAAVDGMRTVAVLNRAWLDILAKTVSAYGARSITALPAQLCLPLQPDGVTAAISESVAEIDVTLRLSAHDGIGLAIVPQQPDAAMSEALQALSVLVPQAQIALYVPQASVRAFQDSAAVLPELASRITVWADNWPRWIAGASHAKLDMMTALGSIAGGGRDWRPWRWTLALAAAVLLVNAAALNFDWWRMRREADSLRTSMLQIYKSAYPKETVIIDPIAQMQQKINAAQHTTGHLTADDFAALAANFGAAWSGIRPGAAGGALTIVALEYRERSLVVRLKGDDQAALLPVQSALAARNLTLSRQSAGVWQIRSAK